MSREPERVITLNEASRILSISYNTGLGLRQVERGMADLKERGVIEPVRFKDDEGRWRYDRSCGGHVAQHRITKDVWASVKLDTERD